MELLKNTYFLFFLFASCIWKVSANQTTTLAPQPGAEEQLDPFKNLLANITLRKCFCKSNQVMLETGCVDQETLLQVVDLRPGTQVTQQLIKTSDFHQVVVSDINCTSGLAKVKLLNYLDAIFVLTDGTLLWSPTEMFIADYCVEHIPNGWQAFVCVPPTVVPRCCPAGFSMGPDDKCIEQSDPRPFTPPIMLNDRPLEGTDVTKLAVKNITCQGVSVTKRLNLNKGEGALLYGSQQALLTYQSSQKMEPEENYCVGLDESEAGNLQYFAKFCFTDPMELHYHKCKNVTCVRKCCPATQFVLNNQCAELNEGEASWKPIFHEKDVLKPGAEPPRDLFFVYGSPFCKSPYELQPHLVEYDKYYLLRDGSLHYLQTHIGADRYCLDMVMGSNGDWGEIVLVCPPEATCQWKVTMDMVLLSLSCIFLIATLCVYIGVPDLRDRTNGRCLISMVVAMLSTYISLLVNNRETNLTDMQCLITGFFGHVFGLAMFFWLNVMCYDMWSTLRSSQQQHQSKKTFIKYSLYAWGLPLVIGIIGRIMDSVQPENLILPNFLDDRQCWFKGDAEYWLYFSGIVFVLLLINVFFFIHVAITLARKLQQRQTMLDNSDSRTSNAKKTKEQAWLYVKLFIVMGVTWIADALSIIQHRNTCTYWVVTDIINALQGVFIFLVAVCNKDNLKKIRNAWKPRVQTARSKISTLRGMSPISTNRKTDISLAASETSRKTSVTSIPRKISTTSPPLQRSSNPAIKGKRATDQSINSEGLRSSGSSLAPRKISTTQNHHETIRMNVVEE